ncbi:MULTISPECIES: hypothetical protein [unclassified Pseudonocardia]|uniref:hypothetical protein n=1 Tax=unclassified Pseudonocardia TaxID=2619320 RepID=UPI0011152748|nr:MULTISPECIES: hypothetical protein [unclassified Pseudonocardia]
MSKFIVRISYAGGLPPQTVFIEIAEYARTKDLRTIEVRKHGWSQSIGHQSMTMELAVLERAALNHLIPDDAEETGEIQEWGIIQQKLERCGLFIALEDLKKVPVTIEVDEILEELVSRF